MWVTSGKVISNTTMVWTVSKRIDRDILEIETENTFKLNEKMVLKKEDKLYHETNNIVIYVVILVLIK